MRNPKEVFETVMRANGHTNFEQLNGRYVNVSMQNRYRYFLMGWEMRGLP